MKRVLILAVTLLSITACGYHLVGLSSTLPEDIQTIYVPTFTNNTGQPELEQRLTNAVANELVARGRYRVAASEDEADAILRGTIKSFSLTPVALDQEGRATDYQLTLNLSVDLIRPGEEEPLWHTPSFIYREQYTVGTVVQDYYDRLFQAVDTLSLSFAQSLITSIIEGF